MAFDSISGASAAQRTTQLNTNESSDSSEGLLANRAKKFANVMAEYKLAKNHQELSNQIGFLLKSIDKKSFKEYKDKQENIKLNDNEFKLSVFEGQKKITLIPPGKEVNFTKFNKTLSKLQQSLDAHYKDNDKENEVSERLEQAKKDLFSSGEFIDKKKQEIISKCEKGSVYINFSEKNKQNEMRIENVKSSINAEDLIRNKISDKGYSEVIKERDDTARQGVLLNQVVQEQGRETPTEKTGGIALSSEITDEGKLEVSDRLNQQPDGETPTEETKEIAFSLEVPETGKFTLKECIRGFGKSLKSKLSKEDKRLATIVEQAAKSDKPLNPEAGIKGKDEFEQSTSSPKSKPSKDIQGKTIKKLQKAMDKTGKTKILPYDVNFFGDTDFANTPLRNVKLTLGEVPVDLIKADTFIHSVEKNKDKELSPEVLKSGISTAHSFVSKGDELKPNEITTIGVPNESLGKEERRIIQIEKMPKAKFKLIAAIKKDAKKLLNYLRRKDAVKQDIKPGEVKTSKALLQKLSNTYVNAFRAAYLDGAKAVAFKDIGETEAGLPREVSLTVLGHAIERFEEEFPEHGMTFNLHVSDNRIKVQNDVQNLLEEYARRSAKDVE